MIMIVDHLSFLVMVLCNALYFIVVLRSPGLGFLDNIFGRMFDSIVGRVLAPYNIARWAFLRLVTGLSDFFLCIILFLCESSNLSERKLSKSKERIS